MRAISTRPTMMEPSRMWNFRLMSGLEVQSDVGGSVEEATTGPPNSLQSRHWP